jgi:hypothetical protein
MSCLRHLQPLNASASSASRLIREWAGPAAIAIRAPARMEWYETLESLLSLLERWCSIGFRRDALFYVDDSDWNSSDLLAV